MNNIYTLPKQGVHTDIITAPKSFAQMYNSGF